jgi:hypothetical protein
VQAWIVAENIKIFVMMADNKLESDYLANREMPAKGSM